MRRYKNREDIYKVQMEHLYTKPIGQIGEFFSSQTLDKNYHLAFGMKNIRVPYSQPVHPKFELLSFD